jgi:hypothetical protein
MELRFAFGSQLGLDRLAHLTASFETIAATVAYGSRDAATVPQPQTLELADRCSSVFRVCCTCGELAFVFARLSCLLQSNHAASKHSTLSCPGFLLCSRSLRLALRF